METKDIRIEEAHKALETGLAAMVAGDDWKKYLEVQSRFHSYSFGNVLWLMFQAMIRGVEVRRFAGYRTWQSLGRQVRKGEKAFAVLAPMKYKRTVEKDGVEQEVFGIRGFRVESTFDVSQTDGEELPEAVTKLEGTSEEIQASFDKLAAWSKARGVPVSRESTGTSANGYFERSGRIVVRPDLTDLQALKTLVHEIAHSLLHADIEDCHSRSYMEVEAESTAFVVMNVLGYDSSSYSFGYVASWSDGDTKLVKTVGERVQKTAKTIITALQASEQDSE